MRPVRPVYCLLIQGQAVQPEEESTKFKRNVRNYLTVDTRVSVYTLTQGTAHRSHYAAITLTTAVRPSMYPHEPSV